MLKWVTVRVLEHNPDGYRLVELSQFHNEATGKRSALTLRQWMSKGDFAKHSTDHGRSPEDFPVGVPVRVWELA